MIVTRFAPSPNGSLHLGHAYSAIVAHDRARERGGRFLLRIEDIDGARNRPALADEFRADLAWLGLTWDEVAPQSARLESYAAAAERLRAIGVLYRCVCSGTRRRPSNFAHTAYSIHALAPAPKSPVRSTRVPAAGGPAHLTARRGGSMSARRWR